MGSSDSEMTAENTIGDRAGAARQAEPFDEAGTDATRMDHEFRSVASRWRPVRRWAMVAYIAAFAVSAFAAGVPLSRVTAVAWTLGAFAVYSIGRGWRLLGRALVDWLPFTAVMVCYDLTRGVADELGRDVHVSWPVAADRRMFDGAVHTVWLQQHFHTPDVVHWYDVLASVTYLSYFFVVPLTMAVMWIRNRSVWRRFTANVVALSFAALATYVVFPEAPPWYASTHGVIGPVERLAGLVWGELGLRTAGDLIEEGQATANAVAAMPSLHFGYAMLVAVFFRKRVSRRIRPLLLAYPPAMAISLVYTGEHYVIDVLAGVVYVLVITSAVNAAAALIARMRTGRPRIRVQPSGYVDPADAPDAPVTATT
jgi:hypothetical protein